MGVRFRRTATNHGRRVNGMGGGDGFVGGGDG